MPKYFEWFGLPGKFVITMLLSLFSALMAVIFHTEDRVLCMIAMLLSSMGDILLMNFKNIEERLPFSRYYTGMLSFALSHIFYISAFYGLIRNNGYSLRNAGFYVAAVLVLAVGILFTVAMAAGGHFEIRMYLLHMLYLLVIGANCVTVCSYACSAGHTTWIAAVGVLSFFISDVLIGLNHLLSVDKPWLWSAIWWFYPIGQFLLLLRG